MAEGPGSALDLGQALARLESAAPRRESGRVTEVTGLVVRASVPGVRVGEIVTFEGSALEAEVVGFRGDEVVLMPLGEATGIGPDSLVTATGRPLAIAVSDGILGRVLDGLGPPDRRWRPDRGGDALAGRSPGAQSAGPPPREPPAGAGRPRARRPADRR